MYGHGEREDGPPTTTNSILHIVSRGKSGSQPFVQAEELTGRGVRSKREADPCPATAAVD